MQLRLCGRFLPAQELRSFRNCRLCTSHPQTERVSQHSNFGAHGSASGREAVSARPHTTAQLSCRTSVRYSGSTSRKLRHAPNHLGLVPPALKLRRVRPMEGTMASRGSGARACSTRLLVWDGPSSSPSLNSPSCCALHKRLKSGRAAKHGEETHQLPSGNVFRPCPAS